MRLAHHGVAVLVGALVALPARARAQDDERPRHFHDRAVAQATLGHYDLAAEEFLREYALTGKPEVLFNVAECHRLRFNKTRRPDALRDARRYYLRFIDLAASSPQAPRARAWLATIDEELKRHPPPEGPARPAGPGAPLPAEPAAPEATAPPAAPGPAASTPASPPPTPAQPPSPSAQRFRLELGGALGVVLLDEHRDLGSAAPGGTLHQPEARAGSLAARAALLLPLAASSLAGIVPGLELELAIVPAATRQGAELTYAYAHASLLVAYPVLDGRLQPFLLAGVGTVRLVSEPPPKGNGEAMATSFQAGLGVSYRLVARWPLSARVDARYLRLKVGESVSKGTLDGTDDLALTAGLSYALGW